MSQDMLPVEDAAQAIQAYPPEVAVLRAPGGAAGAYRDQSTVFLIPTRGLIHHAVVDSWLSMVKALNQRHSYQFVAGYEVGEAYNEAIRRVLAHPLYSKWKYVCTLEDDNLVAPHSFVALLETIEEERAPDGAPYDAVSAVYCTKDARRTPLVAGDWRRWKATGDMDTGVLDLARVPDEEPVVPVCVIPQGCAIWRLDLFRRVPEPWFHTTTKSVHAKLKAWRSGKRKEKWGVETQDYHFCVKATRDHGAHFAIDLRVPVGHLDVNSGLAYYPVGVERWAPEARRDHV